MKRNKNYVSPTLELRAVLSSDVITTSGASDTPDGGENIPGGPNDLPWDV